MSHGVAWQHKGQLSEAAVPEQSGGNSFNEKMFVAEMNHDTSLSQMEMPHGYTGTSGSGF